VTRKERIAELERENEELRRQGEERARESSTLQEQVERLRKQNATGRDPLRAPIDPATGIQARHETIVGAEEIAGSMYGWVVGIA
jgi:predicted nuclease with TOPRIM domain